MRPDHPLPANAVVAQQHAAGAGLAQRELVGHLVAQRLVVVAPSQSVDEDAPLRVILRQRQIVLGLERVERRGNGVPVERPEPGARGRARGRREPEPVPHAAAVGAHQHPVGVPAEEALDQLPVTLETSGGEQDGPRTDLLAARDDALDAPVRRDEQRPDRRVQAQIVDRGRPVIVQRVDVGPVRDAETEVPRPPLRDRHAGVAGRRHSGLEALDEHAAELRIAVREQLAQRRDVGRGP
jgi:hypothetical protein